MPIATIDSAARALRQRVVGLYAVTPDIDDTAWLVQAVAAAVAGGASMVQYRNKTAGRALAHEQAAALATAVGGRALLIVNDDPHLARDVGAHGVHVGEDDAAIGAARDIVGPHRLIGVSCYDDAQRAVRAAAAGADYVAFGSFFLSSVKPGARRAHAGLLATARALDVPLVAIGGITAENAGSLRDAGADAVAVISAVFGAGTPRDIESAARRISAVFNARSSRT